MYTVWQIPRTTVLAGRSVNLLDGESVGTLLQAAGLEKVTSRPILLPCGDYGGRVGKMLATDYISGAKGPGGVVIARDLASPEAQCTVPFYLAFGRRRG